ncbi:alpha/beta-hydrolase, partial [Linderina pennispora]
ATVTLVHGLSEHIDRYEDLARAFARAGIQALGFDQRGFGRTGEKDGNLGHNQGIQNVLDDVAAMNKRATIDGVPHFLFGHSMGGFISLKYCAERNSDKHVRGVVCSAPALRPGKTAQPAKVVELILKQVVKFAPSIKKESGIATEHLTNNQAELDKFNASPLNLSYCSLGTMADIYFGGLKLLKEAAAFATPVYLIHADGDMATDYEGTREFYSKLPEHLDKHYEEIKGCKYHEIHFQNDLDIDIPKTYTQWILQRL